jgi:hypothetical protein
MRGTTRLQNFLGFSPTSRTGKGATPAPAGSPTPTTSTTGTLKRWRKGQVPQDQTLDLIAKKHPGIAIAIRYWRDCPVVWALAIKPTDIRTLARPLLALSEDCWAGYLAVLAFGRRDPQVELSLTTYLFGQATESEDASALAAIIAVEISLASSVSFRGKFALQSAYLVAVRNAAQRHPEIRFTEDDIRALRRLRRDGVASALAAGESRFGVVVPFVPRRPQSSCPRAAKNLKFVTKILAELNELSGSGSQKARK